jgi:hypothetical protein
MATPDTKRMKMKMTEGESVAPIAIETLLLPEEAGKILKLSLSWLAKARGNNSGPPFVRIGRAIRYQKSGLQEFIKAQTHTSISN